MKGHFTIVAIIKGLCFAIPLLLISLILKFSPPFAASAPLIDSLHVAESKQTTFYFIGTSRTQRCIAPEALGAELPGYNFVNLGLSSGSFLYNCKAASNLMKAGYGKRVIFIELTGLAIHPPYAYHSFLTAKDVGQVMKQHMSVQLTLEDVSGLCFYLFSINGDLKQYVLPRVNLNFQPETGFLESRREYSGPMDAMLTPERLAARPDVSPELLAFYFQIINQLNEEANESGSEIQFMLPLTLHKASEIAIDMAVFANLPDVMKWTYSPEFLASMHHGKYMADISHLNTKGAVVYSQELSKFIKARFRDTQHE